MPARRYVHMRASTADLERSIQVLKTSFVEGRLTRQELDLRVGQALVSRLFAELMALTADLPVGTFGRLPAHPATPAFGRPRRLAVARAALVVGWLVVLLSAAAALLVALRSLQRLAAAPRRGQDAHLGRGPAAWAAARNFGTTMRQASMTNSRISAGPTRAMCASIQLNRPSLGRSRKNLSGSAAIIAARSSRGKAKPMTVSSGEIAA
jgi:Domain of unknown function (DUF1707)